MTCRSRLEKNVNMCNSILLVVAVSFTCYFQHDRADDIVRNERKRMRRQKSAPVMLRFPLYSTLFISDSVALLASSFAISTFIAVASASEARTKSYESSFVPSGMLYATAI
jgi:hypothetical protein